MTRKNGAYGNGITEINRKKKRKMEGESDKIDLGRIAKGCFASRRMHGREFPTEKRDPRDARREPRP